MESVFEAHFITIDDAIRAGVIVRTPSEIFSSISKKIMKKMEVATEYLSSLYELKEKQCNPFRYAIGLVAPSGVENFKREIESANLSNAQKQILIGMVKNLELIYSEIDCVNVN